MSILKHVFEIRETDDITKRLGNMIVSGTDNEGSKKLYFNMLLNLLRERKTVVLVNGSLSGEKHKTLINYVRPLLAGRVLYDLNLSAGSDTVDILSAFQTSDQKADFIVSLLSQSSDRSDLLKNKARRFFLCAISAMDAMRTPYNLRDLSVLDLESVSALVAASPLPEPVKNRHLRFLEDAGTYSSFLDLESAMIQLESWGLTRVMSGTLSIKKMLSDGNVMMISGLLSDDFRAKEALFNALFYALTKFLERERSASKIAFLIKKSDFISGDNIKNTLEYNLSYPFASYIFVEDITKYIAKNGNPVLDLTKAFLVLNQGSGENAAFWSAFFGSRDTQEKSYSFTSKKSWNPFANMMDNGGVVSTSRKYNSATTSLHKVNKPIYRPEVFTELQPSEAMLYLREPLMRRKVRIEE